MVASITSSLNSLVFCACFLVLLYFSGGILPIVLSFGLSLAIAVLSRKYIFLINKRLPVPNNAFAVITGCSTGIGYDAALRLAAEGFEVFATVRSTTDGAALLQAAKNSSKGDLSNRIEVLFMDVCNTADVDKAVARVRVRINEKGGRLLGLIHNAGFSETGPLELLPRQKLEKQFNTNVYAPVSISQSFLPLLREGASKGHTSRLIFVSSGVGLMTIPGHGVYSATKHAIEAIADAFRMELSAWPIDVILIEPGAIATNFQSTSNATRTENEAKGAAEAEKRGVDRSVIEHYQRCNQQMALRSKGLKYGTVSCVSEAFLEGLLDDRPLTRLLVGPGVSLLPLFSRLPDVIIDTLLGGAFRK